MLTKKSVTIVDDRVAWHFANPCPQAGLASAEHRLRMCEIAVEVSPKSLADSRSIKLC